MTHFNVVGLYQCIDELVSVWFYFTFIFIIEFVLMVFDMKFVSDGLQTVSVMKIELRISPDHLHFITPSDKSFLLWKWILWCIIWFSLWKWPFILYYSCDSRGAPAPFHFIGVSSGRRESESLVASNSRRHISPKPIIYVDIWIYNFSQPWIWLQFTNLWPAWHSPRFRALPPTTIITWKANAIALIKIQTIIIF